MSGSERPDGKAPPAGPVDFDALAGSLRRLEPVRLTLEETLDRIREELSAARGRGVSLEQIRDALRDHGLKLAAASLAAYLETGSLAGRRRKLIESRIDFASLRRSVGRLRPLRPGLQESLDRVGRPLRARHRRGVTVAQLRSALADGGLKVPERTLLRFLETGSIDPEPEDSAAADPAAGPPSGEGESSAP